MSLFSALNTATRGMAAAQAAIQVTGQNISNANTEGYTRKRVELSPDSRRDGVYGSIGMGVEITSIARIRDIYIDQQIAEQIGDRGKARVMDEAMEKLEGLFAEPGDGGFNTHLNNFWNAWQDLANNPSDLAARGAVRTSAEVVTDMFHSVAQDLRMFRESRMEVLDSKVRILNGLMRDIHNLNTEIASQEAGNSRGAANDTRDQRDLMVRQLAEMVDVKYFEDELGRVTITTAGSLLVGPTSAVQLELYSSSKMLPDGSMSPVITELRFADSKKVFTPNGGELRAIMDVKDVLVPKYQNYLDTLAKTLVTEVNALHSEGYNLNRSTGVFFFDVSQTTAQGIKLSPSILKDVNNIAAAPAGRSSLPINFLPVGGVPALADPVIRLSNINPLYRDIIPGSLNIEWNGQSLQEGPGKDYVVDYQLGTIHFINYAKYGAGDALDVTLRHREGGYPGDGVGSLALAIAQLRQTPLLKPDPTGKSTQTLDQFYSSFVGELGIERQQAKSTFDTKSFLIAQLDSRQQSVAGVSLDEEMTNMIKFEHSYQASARFISVINSMLDTLLNI